MSRVRLVLSALVSVLLVAACNRDDMLRQFASDADEKVARECIDAVRHGKLDEIEARLQPSLKNDHTHAELLKMVAAVPAGEPDAVKLVGAQKYLNNGVHSTNLTYEYRYGTHYFMMNCATIADAPHTIIGLSVNPLKASLEESSAFDLKGKSAWQYTVLLAGIVFMVMTLVALIRCIMDKTLRRKWLWILFILIGIGELSINWTTGASEFHPLYFLLFSASAVSPGYGPWTVSVALPVGAAVYLVRRYLNHRSALRSNGG